MTCLAITTPHMLENKWCNYNKYVGGIPTTEERTRGGRGEGARQSQPVFTDFFTSKISVPRFSVHCEEKESPQKTASPKPGVKKLIPIICLRTSVSNISGLCSHYESRILLETLFSLLKNTFFVSRGCLFGLIFKFGGLCPFRTHYKTYGPNCVS